MVSAPSTAQISWEYLMPKRRERMALYIRESDPRLATSTTIESQAKLAREYGEKEGYIYNPDLEFREAVSAYEVPYTERVKLLQMLDAAKKKLFDVLVVSEVRAISRRQVEVLVIYDMLLKYGVRLETVKEKFGEDAMSKAILSLRSMFVEIEVEQSRMRMMRGRADRVAIGQAPNGGICVYTHILVDTETEVSGRYELNHEVVYTDPNGKQWTPVLIAKFFCNLLASGGSLAKSAQTLNAMGIPSAKGKHWTPETIRRIVSNPILYGQPYANRYKQIGKHKSKNGKQVTQEIMRPVEEWIPLPPCPAVITKETFDAIQEQIKRNRQESLRNNKHADQLGLLRSGHIYCGICQRQMFVSYPSKSSIRNRVTYPFYTCRRKTGNDAGIIYNHRTQISLPSIETAVKEKIAEVLDKPEMIRARVEEIRQAQKPAIDTTSIEETIAGIDRSIKNLYNLAKHATTDDMVAGLAQEMNQLEQQKMQAKAMLCDIAETEEKRLEIEVELVKFETWAEKVRPFLTDPEYLKTASYDELRLATRILGVRVTVFPTQGEWEYRYKIDVTVPGVAKKLNSISIEPCPEKPTAWTRFC
jgi:DNA invertase Pin-like site-specific DNA recombinase